MGQLLTIFGSENLRGSTRQCELDVDDRLLMGTARQIPGSHSGRFHSRRQPPQASGVSDKCWEAFKEFSAGSFQQLLSGLLNNFSPDTVLTLVADLAWMTGLYFGGSAVIGRSPNWALFALYLLIYQLCADQARLYSGRLQSAGPQLVLAKALTWTTFMAVIAIACGPETIRLLPLFLWSCANWLVLSARREIWRLFDATLSSKRRVLIIGDTSLGVSVAEALRRDANSSREVREFILDRSLREPLGLTMMRQSARRECIDEVIVATHDPALAQIAIREAQRNQWDAFVIPDLHGAAALGFENINGLPMLKVCEQRLPEYALALKRVVDVALSVAGLIALAPLLLLIAAMIKLDSPGPALYCALRIGRKAARFKCYKFRTMVRQADQLKIELRLSNQRNGAFFKIEKDPRITRCGRFLRRYSLDELPQLWNVLVGDMSLVGPRPHPADDVERYSVEDLRRLDFVPGMTGLWQVTARRDASFKRCVELDIEYITHWNVMLDLKILCRTITAVFQGSGA